jgi:hypothetical protein
VIMDGSLKVISVNKSFYVTFKVNPKETVGKYIYELGNGQWNIPMLKKLLRKLLPSGIRWIIMKLNISLSLSDIECFECQADPPHRRSRE